MEEEDKRKYSHIGKCSLVEGSYQNMKLMFNYHFDKYWEVEKFEADKLNIC